MLDRHGASTAATLDQHGNRRLALHRALAAVRRRTLARLTADIDFVRFNDLAGTAQLVGRNVAHRLADAMAEEPCRLVSDAKGAVHLVGADTLLRRRHEAIGE